MNSYSTRISEPVRQKLLATHLQRAVIWFLALSLALLSIAAVLSCAAMLIDWTLSIRQMWVRGMISLVVLALLIKAGLWCRAKLKTPAGLIETASWLDRVNPPLEERLATTVELEDRTDCSQELLHAVSKQVDEIKIEGSVRRILDGNRFRYVMAGFVAALAATGVLYLVCGSNSWLLAERLMMPWSAKTLTQLPDVAAATQHRKGRDLEVSIPISGKIPQRAKLQQRDANGTIEERFVQIDPQSGVITSTFPQVKSDFAYRVFAGDDQTPWSDVKVFDYPQTKDLSLRVTPPAYTGRPERTWDKLPRRITAPEGSLISLSFGVDQPLSSANVIEKAKGKEAIRALDRQPEERFSYERKLSESVNAELKLTAALADITSRFPVTFIAQPDRKPQVQLLKETETFALKADETLEVKFRAHDDYGIAQAEVVAKLEQEDGSKEEFRFPVELGEQADQRQVEAALELDLKQLPIEAGTRLSYQVEVWDRRGEMSRDESRQIMENMAASQQIAALQQARQRIEDLQQALQAAQNVNNEALAAVGAPAVNMEQAGIIRNRTRQQNQRSSQAQPPGAKPDSESKSNPDGKPDSGAKGNTDLVAKSDSDGKTGAGKNTQSGGKNDVGGNSDSRSPSAQDQTETQLANTSQDNSQSKQKQSGQPATGQQSRGANPAELSAQTQRLLDSAAQLAAQLADLVPTQRDPLAEQIQQAQSSVAAAQETNKPAAPLTQAGEQIAKARASVADLAEDLDRKLADAKSEYQRQRQVEDLRNVLAAAKAMAAAAQRLSAGQSGQPSQANDASQPSSDNQANNSNQTGSPNQANDQAGNNQQASNSNQSGDPSQANNANQTGSNKQARVANQSGNRNQSAAAKQSLKESLAALARQLEQAGEVARDLPDPELMPSIMDSINRAEAAATKANQEPNSRDDQLASAAREIDNALANLAKSESNSATETQQSNFKPGIDVAKRMLDLAGGGNCGCSGSAEVTVDEFQNYLIAGDKQKKQSIAIRKVLELIRIAAEDGRKTLAEVSGLKPEGEGDEAGKPDEAGERFVQSFRDRHASIVESLNQGVQEAEELRAISADTPYAFFGLQAKALVENGFDPAITGMNEGLPLSDPDELGSKVKLVDERLRWVIAFLEKSQAQFQEMIELEEVVALTHQFRKMHNITLEDMPLATGISGSQAENDKSKYPSLKAELSDQAVQQVIAALKLKREVLKRLSALLQKDPALRARLLAQGQQSKKIYREELTRLRNRQKQLAEVLAAGIRPQAQHAVKKLDETDEAGQEQGPVSQATALDGIMRRRLLKFANEAGNSLGNARIWLPRETPDDVRKLIERRLSALSDAVDSLAQADHRDLPATKRATSELESALEDYDSALAKARRAGLSAEYIEYRREDLAALKAQFEDCNKLVKHLQEKEVDQFIAHLQKELGGDTQRTALALMSQLGVISGIDQEIDEKIEALEELLTNDLFSAQERALKALEANQRLEAVQAKQQAASELEAGVKLLDASLIAFVRAQSTNESPQLASGAQPLPDLTESQISDALEKLLRKLEQEARGVADPNLGLTQQANLQVTLDWQKTPEEKEEERKKAQQRRQQQKQQAQQAFRRAAQAQNSANRRAEAISRSFYRAPTLTWKERQVREFQGRNDWNSLPSELQESVNQEFDPSIPPEYRAAIQRYFRIIAEANQQ